MPAEIRLYAFTMNCIGHQSPGLWAHPRDRSAEYTTLRYWTTLPGCLRLGCSTACSWPTCLDPAFGASPGRVWTVRDMADHVAIGGIGPVFVGSPSTVADAVLDWVERTGVDGLNLCHVVTHKTFANVATWQVPRLQRRGRFKMRYSSGTLHERLTGGPTRLRAPHPAAAYRPAYKAPTS